jgi:Fe2+ or Zn2+ uptake regulation protein
VTQFVEQARQAINSPTVYRTLAFLKERSLIKARYYDQDNHCEMFEPSPRTEHYHFSCTHCGQVLEFESKHVPWLKTQLESEFGVDVARACLRLTGLCQRCCEKSKPGKTA